VRWACVEALQRARRGTPMRNRYDQIVARRGGNAQHLAKGRRRARAVSMRVLRAA
jgi:hypothetical protein